MKNIIIIFALTLLAVGFSACDRSETLNPNSVIKDKNIEKNALDIWLDENYRRPYNINFIYRMKDTESDMNYNLAPVDYETAGTLAKITKHVWFEAYDEVAGADAPDGSKILKGVHFMRNYSPRVIHLIGSGAYNDGTRTLGTAEGGLKVVLYSGNSLDETDMEGLNQLFFHTLHHEFSHILHQTYDYPVEYDQLSAGHYAPTSWTNRKKIEDYAPLGFVTAYAGSQGREDIAEVTSGYITFSDAKWAEIKKAAGETGWPLIEQKISLIKQYMTEYYGIDMDQLRKVVVRRSAELNLFKGPVGPIEWTPDSMLERQQTMALDCATLFSLPQFNTNSVLKQKNLHSHQANGTKCCH